MPKGIALNRGDGEDLKKSLLKEFELVDLAVEGATVVG